MVDKATRGGNLGVGPGCRADLGRVSTRRLRNAVRERFALDLAGFLNLADRDALDHLATGCKLGTRGTVGEIRSRLWRWGAEREAGGSHLIGTPVQPLPVALAGRLVFLGAVRGLSPPASSLPRPIPPPARPPRPTDEPDCLEDLLANADALAGVRLGGASRDKGAFGCAIAAMLGVRERGWDEPDWRGEVEIKSVPVVRDRRGIWRVKEDPAISMEQVSPLRKMARVLWIARAALPAESVVLGWYYQELDGELTRLARAHLHTRPKGRAGTSRRGWYLHKGFFIESGFLRVLNG